MHPPEVVEVVDVPVMAARADCACVVMELNMFSITDEIYPVLCTAPVPMLPKVSRTELPVVFIPDIIPSPRLEKDPRTELPVVFIPVTIPVPIVFMADNVIPAAVAEPYRDPVNPSEAEAAESDAPEVSYREEEYPSWADAAVSRAEVAESVASIQS